MRLLVLLIIFLARPTFARIVLLTSFRDLKTEVKAEKAFRKALHLGLDEELEVIHRTDQWRLYQSLNDQSVHALFWVSHGVSQSRGGSSEGAEILPKLLDYRGDNVAPVFSLLGEQLKFISIIGCNSAAILEYYGVYPNDIASYIPNIRAVALQRQIPRAIQAFRAADLTGRSHRTPDFATRTGHILITRKLQPNEATRSLRIYIANHLVGLLPAASASAFFPLPSEGTPKVRLESGQDPSSAQAEFGQISITSSDLHGRWELFKTPQGTPFGTNQRVFIYRE